VNEMRRVLAGLMMAGMLAMSGTAFAQAAPPPPPPPPSTTPAAPAPGAQRPAPKPSTPPPPASSDSRGSIVITGGVAAVQHVGATIGALLAFRVADRVDVVGEAAWAKDAVTRRRVEAATSVASFLQTTQGKAAVGTIEAPAFYGGGGIRVMLSGGSTRPYIIGTGGVARLVLKPVFTLAGTDVTTNLTQYGITLGSDLTGEVTKPAFGGGIGVIADRGRWYVDASFRVLSIQTEGQATNVLRAGGGIGFTF